MLLGDFDIIKVLQSANILNCMSLSIALLCNANLVHKILQDGGHYANICHVQCWPNLVSCTLCTLSCNKTTQCGRVLNIYYAH